MRAVPLASLIAGSATGAAVPQARPLSAGGPALASDVASITPNDAARQEQLGLIERQNRAVNVLVIDGAEQPTEG